MNEKRMNRQTWILAAIAVVILLALATMPAHAAPAPAQDTATAPAQDTATAQAVDAYRSCSQVWRYNGSRVVVTSQCDGIYTLRVTYRLPKWTVINREVWSPYCGCWVRRAR